MIAAGTAPTTALKLLATGLILFVGSLAWASTGESADTIRPTDPRFNVFELSNAAGGGTYASMAGTISLA